MPVIIAGAFWFTGSSAEDGGESSFAVKREYGSVITHRHTRVMIWEIRLGVGYIKPVLLLFFKVFLYEHTDVVLFYLFFNFLFMHLPDNWSISCESITLSRIGGGKQKI